MAFSFIFNKWLPSQDLPREISEDCVLLLRLFLP